MVAHPQRQNSSRNKLASLLQLFLYKVFHSIVERQPSYSEPQALFTFLVLDISMSRSETYIYHTRKHHVDISDTERRAS